MRLALTANLLRSMLLHHVHRGVCTIGIVTTHDPEVPTAKPTVIAHRRQTRGMCASENMANTVARPPINTITSNPRIV